MGIQFLKQRQQHLNRNRSGSLMVIVLTAVTFLVLGWFFVKLGQKITLKEIESELEGKIVTASALIHQFLSGPMTVVKLMASEDAVLRALYEPQSPEAVAVANRLMDHYLELSGVSVTGVYTAEGRILATYSGGHAFLGRDLSFRPYIRNALKGRNFQYLALGHNEKQRGYYAATPVRGRDGVIMGVAMVKKEIREDLVGLDKTGHVFFVSPDGVISLSSDPDSLYRSLGPIPENKLSELLDSKQFGDHRLEPLSIEWKPQAGEAIWANKAVLYKEVQVGPPGWRLVILGDKSPVFRTRYLLTAIAFSIFLVVSLGIFAFIREKETARFLAQSNLELEKRVRVRTTELKNSNLDLQAQIAEREKAEQELKKGEAALRRSEEKYRVLFEAFPLGVSITDGDGNIIEVNRLSEDLLGISPGNHTKKRLDGRDWKIIGANGSPLAIEDIPGVIALEENRLVEDIEMGFIKEGGETIWLNVTAAPVPLEDFGVAIAYNDITERKRAEEDLKKSQNLLDESQRIAHIGSWALDIKTGAISWTDETFRIFGVRPQTFHPTFDEFARSVHPEDRGMVLTHLGQAQRTKQFKNFDYRAKWPDGTVRWIHTTGAVFCDEAGEPVRIIGTLQDVTERKQMEEALLQSEHRYRNIFETASVSLLEEDFSEFRYHHRSVAS